jgi:molybdate transport system regulatory protein
MSAGRLTLEVENRRVVVKPAWMELLESIRRRGRLADACSDMGISYRTGLNWLRTLEELAGFDLVESTRGGREGGSTTLTDTGRKMLEAYYIAKSHIKPGLASSLLESRTSARNLLRGTLKEISTDGIISLATVELDPDQQVKSILTTESVKRLNLKPGDKVHVILKATEALILK